MSKAVLVMNMPECCADCPCSFFERDNPIFNLICGVTQEDAYNVGRPDWCPLRELPERETEMTDADDLGNDYVRGTMDGWNNCLDMILENGLSDSVD